MTSSAVCCRAIANREIDDLVHRANEPRRLIWIDLMDDPLDGWCLAEWIAGHPYDDVRPMPPMPEPMTVDTGLVSCS
jgi:hypothetical protein